MVMEATSSTLPSTVTAAETIIIGKCATLAIISVIHVLAIKDRHPMICISVFKDRYCSVSGTEGPSGGGGEGSEGSDGGGGGAGAAVGGVIAAVIVAILVVVVIVLVVWWLRRKLVTHDVMTCCCTRDIGCPLQERD